MTRQACGMAVGCEEHLWAQMRHCQACKQLVGRNRLLEHSGCGAKEGLLWALECTRYCATTHFLHSSRSSQ